MLTQEDYDYRVEQEKNRHLNAVIEEDIRHKRILTELLARLEAHQRYENLLKMQKEKHKHFPENNLCSG